MASADAVTASRPHAIPSGNEPVNVFAHIRPRLSVRPEGPSDENSSGEWPVPAESAIQIGSVSGSEPHAISRDASASHSGVGGPESPSGASDSESSGDGPEAHVDKLVAFIEAMRPTDPAFLRACPVYVVLACFGQVFWARKGLSFFHLSKVTEVYDEFLSHSWQVSTWKKVLVLVMLKNGLPACLIAGFGGLVVMAIWQVGFLPGYVKPHFEDEAPGLMHSFWCFLVALLLACFTLLFWRSHSRIFVDRVCINQFDERQKAEGILNIGATLKASRSLLLIWDESYVDRLWCIFELAAFLQSHPDMLARKNFAALRVVPVALGYMASAVVLSCMAFGFFGTMVPAENEFLQWSFLLLIAFHLGVGMAHAARSHFRSLEAMSHQLRQFELSKTSCWCCSVNHVDPRTFQPLICDREIVGKCVATWFGSERAFNDTVRSSVALALEQQLGNDAFPHAWLLCSSSPLLWSFMDVLTSFVREDTPLRDDAISRLLIRYITYWFLSFPIIVTWGLMVSRLFRAKGRCWLSELLRNVFVIVVTFPAALFVVALELWTSLSFYNLPGAIVFAAGCLVAFLLTRAIYHLCNRRYSLNMAHRNSEVM